MATNRFKLALKAMGIHFLVSLAVALVVGAFVFGLWFVHPFRQLAGGTELFLLIMGVDLVCGPLLTLVLYNPVKPNRELVTDLGLVVLVQLAALVYGVWTLHLARPLYLVHEVDRFKVIALVDVDENEITKIPADLHPSFFKGPQTVGLREATDKERETVMFESVKGGRDYAERPEFYVTYAAASSAKAYTKAKPLGIFAEKQALQKEAVQQLLAKDAALKYLPVLARQDWVAVLNKRGEIVTYLKGDGF